MKHRQRRAVRIPLPEADVDTALGGLRQRAAGPWRKPWLRVRVNGEGEVRARIAQAGIYQSPPRLVGRVTRGADGVALEGTILESRNEVLIPRMFTGLARESLPD